MTPFGSAVVPLVNMRIVTSSSSTPASPVGRQAPHRAVETDDRPERRDSAADRVQMLEITRADEHHLDAPRAQHVLELGALRTVVEWDEDGAEHRRGVVRLDVTVGIGVENR